MKPTTNAPSKPYTGGTKIIKHSPIDDHRDGKMSTTRKN